MICTKGMTDRGSISAHVPIGNARPISASGRILCTMMKDSGVRPRRDNRKGKKKERSSLWKKRSVVDGRRWMVWVKVEGGGMGVSFFKYSMKEILDDSSKRGGSQRGETGGSVRE